jgi:CubicO group peptidase (beta-lactamase class C family)
MGRRWWALLAACVVLLAGCTSAPAPSEPAGAAQVREAVRRYFAEDRAGTYRNRRAVLVSVGDQVLLEDYHQASATTAVNVQSMGKSILSCLVGIALSEGRLASVDQTVGELLPSSAASMSSKTKAITLRQLLTMSAGLPPDERFYPEVLKKPDWVRHIVSNGPVTPPGERFGYASAGSHLLSAILRQATGRPTLQYAREKLFEPLGIATTPEAEVVVGRDAVEAYDKAPGFAWPADPQGIHIGGGGQKLTARDMLKFGRLWLAGGRWEGRQIVPEDWLREATRRHVRTGFSLVPGYGYQFWSMPRPEDPAFAAFGYGGQLVEVVPGRSLVVVVLSASPTDPLEEAEAGTAQPEDYVTLVDRVIIPALR